MHKLLLFLSLFLINSLGFSQVTFIIESLPGTTPSEDYIYIAGSMNGWNPGDPAFQMQKNADEKWEIQLAAQADGSSIEFKFTRGDWGTVEKDASGNEMANRQFTFGNGETVLIEIANWADGGTGGGSSTAAENVSIMDEDFYMPQLDRNRRIWIYLPPDYEQSAKSYPVLYMHDGQNLFDSYTAFAGEWEVDETLNELAAEGKNVPIVIGIDNGGAHRMDEYSAWVNTQYGGGEGDEYIRFIAETLKPYVDENYRTKPEAFNTGIMGSSLGGLISQYAIIEFADVFSKGGLFSPSYWYSDSIWNYTGENGNYNSQRIYQIAGSQEGSSTVNNMNQMHDLLLNQGFSNSNLFSKVVQGQGHNEAFWRSEFKEAYLWLFTEFASGVEEVNNQNAILVYPSPAKDQIQLMVDKIDSLRVYNSRGKLVLEEQQLSSQTINIKSLKSGLYFIEIRVDGQVFTNKFVKL